MRRRLLMIFVGAVLAIWSAPVHAQYPPYGYAPRPAYGPNLMVAQRPPMMYQPQPMQYVPRPPMVYQPSPSQFLPPPPRLYQAPTPPRIEEFQPVPETYVEPPTISTQSATPISPPLVTTFVAGNQRHSCSAGVSYLLIKPYFGNNTAFVTRTNRTTTPTDRSSDFSWEMKPAYSAWVSYIGPRGLGMRGNFFWFDQASIGTGASLTTAQAATSAILPPANLISLAGNPNITFGSPGLIIGTGAVSTDILSFSSNLGVYFIDLEATKNASWADLALVFSGGGRFLRMNQDYRASLTNQFGTASETQTLTFTHSFEGAGPTLASDVRMPVGMVTGLSLFGNFRGSLLLGRFTQAASFTQVIVDPNALVGGNATTNTSNSTSRESVMPITELELGAEYVVRVGRLQPVLRASVVNQTYFGAGSASQTDGNLSLFGARLSWGVIY